MTSAVATSSVSLSELRDDLCQKTGRGLNAIVAGIFLWATFTVFGLFVDDAKVLALVYVFGAGVLFPLSLLVARLMRLDPFAQGNPMGVLAGLLGTVQVLFIPLMIGATIVVPDMVPWFLAVLVGAHFLPFSWVYASRTYIVVAIFMSLSAGAIAWLLPGVVAIAVPATVTILLIIAALLLRKENAQAPS